MQFGNEDTGKAITEWFHDGHFATVFSYVYMSFIIFCVLLSLAAPIDKSMTYFRFISAVFSAFTIMTLVGTILFIKSEGGVVVKLKIYTKDKGW